MIFADIPAGASVFLDSNIFIYAFGPDLLWGPPCEGLLQRVELQEINGFTSSHVLSDVAHRLMALEACSVWGWPHAGIVRRLRRHPAEVQKLARYRQAIDDIRVIGIRILPVVGGQVSSAVDISGQYGLLSSDALIVAVMRDHGLVHLASNDPDFDRLPIITRYAPA